MCVTCSCRSVFPSLQAVLKCMGVCGCMRVRMHVTPGVFTLSLSLCVCVSSLLQTLSRNEQLVTRALVTFMQNTHVNNLRAFYSSHVHVLSHVRCRMAEGGERAYQITVFGATGYTGKFVVEELKKRQTKGVAWAVAGRNEDKLKAVLRGRRPF